MSDPWSSTAFETWYAAEYAASGRYCCRGFRCREKIAKGELRITQCWNMEKYPEHYHPECLWKTFQYRNNGDLKITALGEIRGLDNLQQEDVQVFQKLIEKSTKTAEALVDKKIRKKKSSTETADATDGSPTKKARKTTAFIEKLKAEYEAQVMLEAEPENHVGPAKEKPIADDRAVALYGQYHKVKLDELKDYLRWNRQVLKGTKDIVLHKVIDGNLNGRLACCPLDGAKLKLTDDCRAVICSGYWDDDNMVHVSCSACYSMEDSPRVQPWFTREPTQEEKDHMDRLEAVAKGEESKYAMIGDGTVLGDLMEKADKVLELEFTSKATIKASTQKMTELLKESNIALLPPGKEQDLPETVGAILLAHKEETPSQLVKLLAIEFQKITKQAKVAASKGRTYINCPYQDKDEAKALGAKWDFDEKKWYVPGGADITKFAKWR